jgi:chlorobactene lauroyltransferase
MIRAAKNPVGETLVWQLVRHAVTTHFSAVHARAAPPPGPLPIGDGEGESTLLTDRVDSSRSLLMRSPLSISDGEGSGVGPFSSLPVIYCPNHSNWWDGYLCMVLARTILHQDSYLMMEERNLARYRFFAWAGAFGVDRDDPRAAVAALDYAADLLRGQPGRSLYMFPQGTIVPNERRPLRLFSGTARLAQRVGRVYLVPIAFRYAFLQEQHPEAFISIGAGRVVTAADHPRAITAWLGDAITAELDALAADVTVERLATFTTLLHGRAGIDRAFDRLASRARRASRRLTKEA